jgi:ribosomal protein L18
MLQNQWYVMRSNSNISVQICSASKNEARANAT